MLKKSFDSAKQPEATAPRKLNANLLLLIVSAVLMSLAIAAAVYVIFIKKDYGGNDFPSGDSQTASTSVVYKYFSRLTGQGVLSENEVSPKVVGVMIDNNPDAYPQYGLNSAAVVYEAPVEGGITRFMAVYPEGAAIEQVGPVRSARPYYLDWLAEYGTALYMHCGGSQEGLSEIKERNIFDANEFYRGAYYWRDSSRIAPYNLFTSAEKWQKYLADYGAKKEFPEWTAWNFGPVIFATGTESANAFELEYIKRFNVGWRYNSSSSVYERTLNGEVFSDVSGQPVTAVNVLVQYASVSVIDTVGRRKVISIGEGEARMFRDGRMVRGVWKKENLSARTRFYDKNGNEFTLAPGRTWVMIVPEKAVFTVTN